jgi:hypothetical protein
MGFLRCHSDGFSREKGPLQGLPAIVANIDIAFPGVSNHYGAGGGKSAFGV